jgi:F-type H+-transporting ATPase subunit alpha
MNVPVAKVKQFEGEYLSVLKASHKDVLTALKGGKLTDEVVETLTKVIKEVSAKYAG